MRARISRSSVKCEPRMWTGACVDRDETLKMILLWWRQERKRGRSVVAVLAGMNALWDDVWSISMLSVAKRVRRGALP